VSDLAAAVRMIERLQARIARLEAVVQAMLDAERRTDGGEPLPPPAFPADE
jgi:hypothetical protein